MERFWDKVNKTDTCWLWTASKGSKGYGMFRVNGRLYGAHKWSYIMAHGEVDTDGMEVHHSCENPSCVNPEHLSLKTNSTHRYLHEIHRDTHCKRGHEFTEENTKHSPGHRQCRICNRIRQRRRRAEAKLKA